MGDTGLPENWLEQLKGEYPRKMGHQGWESVRVLVPRLVFTWKEPWERILKGVKNYRHLCDRDGKTGSGYVMSASKFFDDRERLVLEYADMDLRTPSEMAQETEWEALERRAAAMGFHTVDRSRGLNVARSAIEAEERKRASNVLQLAGLRAKGVA